MVTVVSAGVMDFTKLAFSSFYLLSVVQLRVLCGAKCLQRGGGVILCDLRYLRNIYVRGK